LKKKLVEALIPERTKKTGKSLTVQTVSNILILNIFKNKKLLCRHCMNLDTYEYATLTDDLVWKSCNIDAALGYTYRGIYIGSSLETKIFDEDKERLVELLKKSESEYFRFRYDNPLECISWLELDYNQRKRKMREERRIKKVNETMSLVPEVPFGLKSWIDDKEINREHYILKDRETGLWSCSSCGELFNGDLITNDNEKGAKNIKNNTICTCPKCNSLARINKRKMKIEIKTYFILLQYINHNYSVARHFKAEITCKVGEKKEINLSEEIRIMLVKNKNLFFNVRNEIYYEQYTLTDYVQEGQKNSTGCFDNKSNRANKREHEGFLYCEDIEKSLKGTDYEEWSRVFQIAAVKKIKVDYNRLMYGKDKSLIKVCELLMKCRFIKLFIETARKISYWSGYYSGSLKIEGKDIEEVFGIKDRQKINRIRDKNEGYLMLEWMKWSEENKQKISDEAISWLITNEIEVSDYSDLSDVKDLFTVEQIMNYFTRQQAESYEGKPIRQVISQYIDYIRMCIKLNKNISDEMVHRPRQLKRRHDEAVIQVEQLNAQIVANEYSKKYPEAESVLLEIRDKFEYVGEEYCIKVPEKIVDIVLEAKYLHHCAGSTDRYFDRIKSNETYICFMRKNDEPDEPFYTIEVEPGGAIRQHRGMYDEEPELDKVKPFLIEWQQEIKKRMSKEDFKLAAVSKQKRKENIEELKANNNTRVLNSLIEDFMEEFSEEFTQAV